MIIYGTHQNLSKSVNRKRTHNAMTKERKVL